MTDDTHPTSTGCWTGLAFLTLAVLTSIVDTSVMTVSTPAIARDFGAQLAEVEWNTTIYSLLFGSTMLLWGKLGGMHGHRLMFVWGNLVFALGSLLVGLSPNIGTMIATRALQGVGAAMLNPSAIALIALSFTPKQRSLAFGINGMAASIGVALGYVVGGVCAEYLGWRWAFFVNIPLCILSAWGVWRFLPSAVEEKRHLPLDFIGALQSLIGLGLAIFSLSEGHTLGWWQPSQPWSIFSVPMPISPIPIALLLSVVVIALFVQRELNLRGRGVEPVFDITLFVMPSFLWGGVVSFLRTLSMFTVNYGLTLYLQLYEGVPALHAAMISFPNALAGMLGAPIGGWLSTRIGAARSVQLGLVAQAVGTIWVWYIVAPTLSVWQLIGPFAVFGFGSGLAGAQLTTASLQDVSRERTGDASGALITVRQLGVSFAVALFALLTSTTLARLSLEGYKGTVGDAMSERIVVMVMLVINLFCIVVSNFIPNKVMAAAPKTGKADHANSAETSSE